MVFNKNGNLITNICLVQIKSVNNNVDISNLTTVYHTPSKITLTNSSSTTESGVLHRKRLSLSYPGLSESDFEKFNDLVAGEYQIMIKTEDNEVYELSSVELPLPCTTSYSTNGHQIVFSGSSPIPYKYRGAQTDDGINIDGFNYDFNFYLS
ncbi:hypothetical protein [Winogradskyella sp.]|uniref:hypothetical protein n=1 Tax=Winogradskyella sp. TaxID=1883156 RepID=UPI003BAC66E7